MKPLIDIRLYDFLKDHHESILNDMIETKNNQNNLSANIAKEIAVMTVKTLNSCLLDRSQFLESHLNEWTDMVAIRSLKWNMSVSSLADMLTHSRQIYCQYIKQFILSQGIDLSPDTTCRWYTLIQEEFDRLLSHFFHRMDSYKTQPLSEQQQLVNPLNPAVIPFVNQMGILPLTTQMDNEQFEFVLEAVPKQCIRLEVNHLFIDLSSMHVMDALIADQLSKLTKILKLLGISATISGMNPAVVLCTVQSGINFSHFSTSSTLKQALRNYGVNVTP